MGKSISTPVGAPHSRGLVSRSHGLLRPKRLHGRFAPTRRPRGPGASRVGRPCVRACPSQPSKRIDRVLCDTKVRRNVVGRKPGVRHENNLYGERGVRQLASPYRTRPVATDLPGVTGRVHPAPSQERRLSPETVGAPLEPAGEGLNSRCHPGDPRRPLR